MSELIPLSVATRLSTLAQFGINTRLRMDHFLAQCAHESAGFTRVEENLNYTSIERLLKIFPRYFNASNVEAYVGDPVGIASRVYANRMGNGDEKSMDGWKYRGRGYFQLTGKDNYRQFGRYINEDFLAFPDLVKNDLYALESAGWFWMFNHCNDAADHDDIEAVTRIINGGLNGLDDRKEWYAKISGKL